MTVTHLLAPADILWKALEAYGLNAESIFQKQGISREMILRPGLRIPHAKVEKLWNSVVGLTKDPCFGLHAVKFWHPSHFNALGHAWLASPTLREAFYRASRYARIVGCDRETGIAENQQEITITLSSSLKLPPLMDLSIAILMSASRMNYGAELNPVGVSFIHAKPDCADQFIAYFKAPVMFDAKTDSIQFSKSVVDKKLPIGNPFLAELHDQYLLRYLEKIDGNNIVERVKGVISKMLPSGKVSDGEVAAKLNMSSRTLQRKLNDRGTTFRSILNEVRKDLAQFYLHDSTTSLMEIAFILGYSEYSSFSRAYKMWTGIPPGLHRKLGRSNPDNRP